MSLPAIPEPRKVVVIFQVLADDDALAERIVEERLYDKRLLMENDSNDFRNGTYDPIVTYVIVPATQMLAESV